jgi:TolB-like protein/Flp pilus assembly protein TadD
MIPVDRAAKRRWMMAGAAVAAVAILAVVIGVWLGGAEAEGPPRLVVLPFENLGAPEDEYFADGITEEITSRLARLSGLSVIARSSAIQYKDSDKTFSQIVEELNVEYLLEGTVRWSKSASGESRVRVSPRLIRGSDETHIWAEPFEAELTDVFALQAEIAEQVATGLHVTLQPEETEAVEARPTENLAAYDVYLRGMDYYERGRVGDNWEAQLLALEMFDSAAVLDPDFALAHVMRFNSHRLLGSQGYYLTFRPDLFGAPARALARAALDEAMHLDPELVEVQRALGRWYLWTSDLVRAEEHLVRVLRRQPNDVETLLDLAPAHMRRDERDSAAAMLQKAGDLDPRSPQTTERITWWLGACGRYEDAQRFADRWVSLAADQPGPYVYKAWWHALAGDTAAAHRSLQGGAERVGLVDVLVSVARGSNLFGRMLRIFDDYAEVVRGLSQDAFGVDTLDYLETKALSYRAVSDLSRAYFDSIVVFRTTALEANPEQSAWRAGRARAYAGSGRKDAAIQDAAAVLREPVDAWNSGRLAEAYVMIGELDAAVEQLRTALLSPIYASPALLRFDPFWDPLRDHPGFQELLAGGN